MLDAGIRFVTGLISFGIMSCIVDLLTLYETSITDVPLRAACKIITLWFIGFVVCKFGELGDL